MTDYSFLRLKDNLNDALYTDYSPVTNIFDYNFIQLLPNKAYCQITNFSGGISLTSDCTVTVVDCSDSQLADITGNVFIDEFTDSDGNNQCSIEYINLNVDFYRQKVLIKFSMNSSDAVFYTNPITITAYQNERTVYFKYKNNDDFNGIGYTNANKWQSISLVMYFDVPIDESEAQDYFQISRENTISSRMLQKHFERYKIEKIDRFTFIRLNSLLRHELVYLDDIRVTNKPVVSSDDRKGDTNYWETDLVVGKNYDDLSPYENQIFTGLEVVSFIPSGIYLTGSTIDTVSIVFNTPISLGSTGTITLYNSDDNVLETLEPSNFTITTTNQTNDTITDSATMPNANGTYYFHMTGGFVNGLGVDSDEISDSTTWTYTVQGADFDSDDFNNEDFLTD